MQFLCDYLDLGEQEMNSFQLHFYSLILGFLFHKNFRFMTLNLFAHGY